MSEQSRPCGCTFSLDSSGAPVGFSRECAETQQLFTRLMRAPQRQDQEAVTAELRQHIADQR